MKRVLITGANSYLGDNTKKYLEEHGDYQVDILDMLDDNWKNTDFSKYDVVFNVCAIVHRPKEKNKNLYFQVNRDLAIQIAEKAKKEGVKQFIQTSTNGVFGIEVGIMSEEKGFHPKTPYEKSKYEADLCLEKLRCNTFKVCIIRPPIIYGRGCKGNFPFLEKYALTHSIFPSKKNKRDMIYIENICDFVKFAITEKLDCSCYPRDERTICVSDMVKSISELNGKSMHLSCIFNPAIFVFYRFFHKLRSVFGNNYCTVPICGNNEIVWKAPFKTIDALKRMYINK